jgi:monoamine oxidase
LAAAPPASRDVIVIGAGAAGLAAARELSAAGRSVVLLEARERVGGRCWTRRMAGLDIPVELGAEFIHGEAAATHALLRELRVRAVDSTREQRYLDRGVLCPVNGFAEAQRAIDGAPPLARDVSFEAFLKKRRLERRTRIFARLMVQGFDAADPRRVSARSIVEEWGEGGSLGASQPRAEGGYGPLLDRLARSLVGRGVRLQLDCRVETVEWRRGSALVRGRSLGRRFAYRAGRVIVTLPLGVLQSKGVRFSPPLKTQEEALAKLASGPVIRVAMRFHSRFWEAKAPGVAFFHVPEAAFPTFWTPLPMQAPLLTAWAGGPKAARLTGSSRDRLVAAALSSVARVFGDTPRTEMGAAYAQDWQADPFSKGGYSYVRVGGEGARERLAQPIEATLFFAGEATDAEEAGTVAGALRSGQRAAREVLASQTRVDGPRT